MKIFSIVLLLSLLGCVKNVTNFHVDEKNHRQLYEKLDQHDYIYLRDYVGNSEEHNELVGAVIDSMLGRDEVVQKRLADLITATDNPQISSRARRSLSGVYVRQMNYEAAVEMMLEQNNLNEVSGVSAHPDAINFFAALAKLPKMEKLGKHHASLLIERDDAGLIRIPININNHSELTLFDTGAAVSTISFGLAQKYGLNFFDQSGRITQSTGDQFQAQFAWAEQLTLGDIIFRNVPFIVVPDDTMQFPEKNYEISTILGLPVISLLSQVDFYKSKNEEHMLVKQSTGIASQSTANLITSGWQLVALMGINQSETFARLFFDTGANKSYLYEFAQSINSQVLQDSKTTESVVSGLGKSKSTEVKRVKNVVLNIDQVDVMHDYIDVLPGDGSFRHGILGMETLADFKKVTFDFSAMQLRLKQ